MPRSLMRAGIPAQSTVRLYGIPILLKDTHRHGGYADHCRQCCALPDRFRRTMSSSCESSREAGAIVLGKATLTEYANFLAIGMPTGYSSLGGFEFTRSVPIRAASTLAPRLHSMTGSPGAANRQARAPAGRIGVNANLARLRSAPRPTPGSILSPANANGIVGIKPTAMGVRPGPRRAIIPSPQIQRTARPLTRTVTDAAILFAGRYAGHNPDDPATGACLLPGHCYGATTRSS